MVGYLATFTALTGDDRAALRSAVAPAIEAKGGFVVTRQVVLITGTAG